MVNNLNTNISNRNLYADDARIQNAANYNVGTPSFKGNPNAVDNTPSADTYAPSQQPPADDGGMWRSFKYIVGTYLGLDLLTKGFNKANGGTYEKSLVGRMGRLGDRISNSWLVQNSVVDGMKSTGGTIKTKTKNFVMGHDMTRAMYETPTTPECKAVTGLLKSQAVEDLEEGVHKLTDYVGKNPKSLKAAGATQAEIDALKAKYGKTLFGGIKNEAQAVEEFMIGRLGADCGYANAMADVVAEETRLESEIASRVARRAGLSGDALKNLDQEIAQLKEQKAGFRAATVKNLKLQSMGLTEAELGTLGKDALANQAKIERALESSSKYSKKVNQAFNKVKSITAPTTRLGKLFAKMPKMGMRALTFGGGFLGLSLVALSLGGAVKNTVDAPKEQKVGTAANGLSEAMAWIISMPLAVKAMHAVNGLKNLGKTKAQVDAYQTARKAFNEKQKAGGFASEMAYKRELVNLRKLKNAGVKPTGIKGICAKVANFLSVGLEQIRPYGKEMADPKYKGMGGFFNKMGFIFKNRIFNAKWLPYIGKNVLGYPLRFALYMFAFQPVIDKVFEGVTHAIFGKPYEPDKIKEEQEAAAARRAELHQYPFPNNPAAKEGLNNLDVDSIPDDNLIKQELLARGLAKPCPKETKTDNGNKTGRPEPDNINGIQVDVKNGDKPYMPGDNQGVNGGQNGTNGWKNPNEKDPNISDYDTIPRDYVPTIDPQNLYQFHDPMSNPAAKRNYQNADELMKKNQDLIEKYGM